MPGITDHPDDFLIENGPTAGGYAHGAEAAVAALRPHLSEAIRRKAEMWLTREVNVLRGAIPTKDDAAAGICRWK